MRGHYIETATNSGKRWFNKKNTAKLYGDALVYPQSLLID